MFIYQSIYWLNILWLLQFNLKNFNNLFAFYCNLTLRKQYHNINKYHDLQRGSQLE